MVGRKEWHEMPPALTWEFYFEWGLTFEQFWYHASRGVDEGFIFKTGEPIEEAKESLKKLVDDGHSIHLVTDRSFGRDSIPNTTWWLEKNEIPYDSLTVGADKTVINTDIFLDDRDKNYTDALQAGNTTPVLFNRPWNSHVPNALRVGGWEGFLHLVDIVQEEIDNVLDEVDL
jgi:5'(3')-deoxyribonucleotidase